MGLIEQELTESLERKEEVSIYLKNNYKFSGKILAVDNEHVKIHDKVKGKDRVLTISEISEVEVG
jgi:sRNA-binding regulator protein Hfq